VVLALFAATAWRDHASARPEYALDQIGVAIRKHDATKLAYYADAGAVTDEIVDETVDWLVARRGLDEAIAGAEIHEQGDRAAQIRAAKRALSSQIGRSAATALMTNGSGAGAVGPRLIDALVTQPPLSDVMVGEHLDVRSVDPAIVDGETATISVTLRHRELYADVTLVLELRREVQRDGPHWRLEGMHGFAPALATIDKAQLERIAIANRPREEALAGLLTVGAPTVQRVVAHARTPTFYRLRVPLTNRSPTPITSVTLALTTRAADEGHATVLSVPQAIQPGATAAEVWQLDEPTARNTRIAAMVTHPERLTVHVRSLVLDSAGVADTVSLVRRYREVLASGPPE